MAVVAALPKEGSDAQFYSIPDAELEKYRVQTQPMTPELSKQFLGKDSPSASDAHAVVPTAAVSGGDVSPECYRTCYFDPGPQYSYYYWWCC